MLICNGLPWNKPHYRLLKKKQTQNPTGKQNNVNDKKLWINKREANWEEGTGTPGPSPASKLKYLEGITQTMEATENPWHTCLENAEDR